MYIFVDFKGLVENGLISTRGQVGPLQLLAIRSTTLHRSNEAARHRKWIRAQAMVEYLGRARIESPTRVNANSSARHSGGGKRSL